MIDAAENERLYHACGAAGSLEQVTAFERLWAICYWAAFAMLRAQPDPEAMAADCAQLALIKIHRSLALCHSPERFVAWATQILRRTVIDELRRPATRLRGQLAAAEELPANVGQPAPLVEGNDLTTLLLAAVANGGLSQRSQRVVLGRYFRDQSDETLARTESELSGDTVLPSHVQVTRSKNLAKLRADASLLERLHDYLG